MFVLRGLQNLRQKYVFIINNVNLQALNNYYLIH